MLVTYPVYSLLVTLPANVFASDGNNNMRAHWWWPQNYMVFTIADIIAWKRFPHWKAFCECDPPVARVFPAPWAGDAELWKILWCQPEQIAEQTVDTQVNWNDLTLIWRRCNVPFVWRRHGTKLLSGKIHGRLQYDVKDIEALKNRTAWNTSRPCIRTKWVMSMGSSNSKPW